MDITYDLAQPIIDRLSETLENPISIMNTAGYIVASSDASRLDTRHQGAVTAIQTMQDLSVTKEASSHLLGTREGVTLPLSLHQECIGALGIGGDPEKIALIASIIRVAVISLIETAQMEKLASYRQKILDIWIGNLISDNFEDYHHMSEQAAYLGIDLEQVCSLIVIKIHRIRLNQLSQLEQLITDTVQMHTALHFATYIGQGRFMLAATTGTLDDRGMLHELCDALGKALTRQNQSFHIGVGRPNSGIKGYRQSFLDALHSVRVAERLSSAKRVLYYYENHIFRLLESVPDYVRNIFITNQIEGKSIDPVLLDTLQTYFAMNRHLNETAAALYIHRNTLLFRLKKIKEKLGLDPQNFHDSVALQVLLYLQDLSAPEDHTPD